MSSPLNSECSLRLMCSKKEKEFKPHSHYQCFQLACLIICHKNLLCQRYKETICAISSILPFILNLVWELKLQQMPHFWWFIVINHVMFIYWDWAEWVELFMHKTIPARCFSLSGVRYAHDLDADMLLSNLAATKFVIVASRQGFPGSSSRLRPQSLTKAA